ncbi:Hypothetical Protein FCC1311_005672 [Hondaea fermentalgiana]|uniref:NADH-ubiquinone oxidoreductase 21kDa subunit N-terminal domain-containing protein n=1 Tax=Hondaea fermentalgiana TaxID=2315210 RepID=A0A2R5G211_9STRA|nr:Hypothetical Protein FCC1311_005672 [Hondaea fermentalgiana]|eukprot:GBG24349.1 Hypothetical Protein FCC1311_005672 [Hondaea fermentalgiana]
MVEDDRSPVRNPRFTVIDKDPSFGKVFSYMKPEDLGVWAASAVGTAAAGYAVGKYNRGFMMFGAGCIGFAGGCMLAMQNSYARLIGARR